MAIIRLPEDSELPENVRPLVEARMRYMQVARSQNIHRALAMTPAFMLALNAETELVMGTRKLSRKSKEIVALAVSMTHSCKY